MKLAVPTHRRRGYQAILLAALVSGLLGTAPATQKVYLKLEGSQIASDHLAENWDSWIAALAFGKSLKHAASPAEAAGGARSVPQIKRSFDVVRPLDKATPLLAQAALKGEVFPKLIVLWIREREGATEDRVRIELENVRIASVKLSGGQHAGLRPTERIEDSMTQDVAFVFDNATFLYSQAAEEASPNEPSSEENPAPVPRVAWLSSIPRMARTPTATVCRTPSRKRTASTLTSTIGTWTATDSPMARNSPGARLPTTAGLASASIASS